VHVQAKTDSRNGGPSSVEDILKNKEVAGDMPADQQRLLSQLYRISVQDPDMKLMTFADLQAAATLYQVRICPPVCH
jgi:hypothetical protein